MKKYIGIALAVLMVLGLSGMAMAEYWPPIPPRATLPLSATCDVTVTVEKYAELSLKSATINLNPGNNYCSSKGTPGDGGFTIAANFNATLTIALNHAGSHFATWKCGRGKSYIRSENPPVWNIGIHSGYFSSWFWVSVEPTALELLTQPPGTTTQAVITATLIETP